MTMAEVLEAVAGLGKRFDRHAARLKALERETGMVDSDDPDPDDDDEAKKKAEEAMADDDDPDKDRGRSTRTPGQTMTRAEMHRAARDKDKLARSGKYGNIGINPNPGPSRNKAGDAGMTVGAMLRSALSGGASKTGYRELEVLEENHIAYDRDHLVVPWDFLAEYGRHAAKVERRLPSWEPKEIQAGYVRQVYDTVGKDGHVRTITSAGSSGAGAVGVDLDVARSQLWLHEVSPVLGYMNPVMGVNSEYQIFIGNVAPTGSEVAEGGAHTENNPTLTRLRRTPTIIHYPWSLSGNLSAMDEVGLGSLFENGVQGLILERATRAILSGPNTGALFANNANSFDGLFASGVNLVAFGANADGSITAFDRAVVTAAESQLRKNNATGDNLFWILSNAMVEVAVDKRIGGTDAIVFLAQRDPEKFREGLIGGTTAGLGTRYVETGELGRPHGTAYKQTAIGICGFGSQMVPIFFGQGVEFRLTRLTDTTNTNYSLQMALSFVQANTKNAEAIGQAVS